MEHGDTLLPSSILGFQFSIGFANTGTILVGCRTSRKTIRTNYFFEIARSPNFQSFGVPAGPVCGIVMEGTYVCRSTTQGHTRPMSWKPAASDFLLETTKRTAATEALGVSLGRHERARKTKEAFRPNSRGALHRLFPTHNFQNRLHRSIWFLDFPDSSGR